MVFVAECPFCMARMRVTDHASGSIGKCPRCTSSFTLAPVDELRLPGQVGASPGRARESEIESESIHASGVTAVTVEAFAAATEGLTWPESDSTRGAVPSRLRPEVLAGAAALLLGGSALLCASFSFLCGLVAPLSGLGLVMGGIALVLSRFAAKGRLLLPVTGSVAAGAILNVALFLPAMLGPTYDRSRQGGDPVRNVLRAVPLGSGSVLSQTPEWVNASQYALQRGDLSVQIVGVSVDPMPGTAKSKSKSSQEGSLLVRVRVTLVERQSTGQNKPFDWIENRENNPFGGNNNPNPTLIDGSAKSYSFRESKVFDSGGSKRRVNLFPVQTADEVFAFETPPEGWESLRLEVPAAAWGGAGVFRFTIPASILVSAPAGGAENKVTK